MVQAKPELHWRVLCICAQLRVGKGGGSAEEEVFSATTLGGWSGNAAVATFHSRMFAACSISRAQAVTAADASAKCAMFYMSWGTWRVH